MARKQETLRYFVSTDGYSVITVPNVPDKGSNRCSWMMTLLDLFANLAIGHGSNRSTDPEGNVYWEAKFKDHDFLSVLSWFTWHNQYEKVDNKDQLWVVPVNTDQA